MLGNFVKTITYNRMATPYPPSIGYSTLLVLAFCMPTGRRKVSVLAFYRLFKKSCLAAANKKIVLVTR